jgi:hypothetical protein
VSDIKSMPETSARTFMLAELLAVVATRAAAVAWAEMVAAAMMPRLLLLF